MMIVLTAAAVWSLSGVIIATLLARHGHNFWLYVAMGLAYGPFLVLIWMEGAQGQPTKSRLIQSDGPINEDGWIDVLVGLDGSDAAVESIRKVLDTLGVAVRRLRLTSVLDHEISNAPDAFTTDDRRVAYLHDAAESLHLDDAEISLASGQPDKALLDHATSEHFDLVIVAHRRNDVISGLRGSTAGRLARTAHLPVLIGPPA